jgi:hypothetical protein
MILDGVVRSERRRKRGEEKEKRNQTKDNGGSVGMNREKSVKGPVTPRVTDGSPRKSVKHFQHNTFQVEVWRFWPIDSRTVRVLEPKADLLLLSRVTC